MLKVDVDGVLLIISVANATNAVYDVYMCVVFLRNGWKILSVSEFLQQS